MKRYNTLSSYFKKIYGGKTAKISVNAGFSCPNRLNGGEGCLFCTDSGGSEFSGNSKMSIELQISEGKKKIADKWSPVNYIAYFQNFSNTFEDSEKLRELYDKALKMEEIVGIAIATRPDCFNNEILNLLDEYNKKTFVWIELGLQTSSEETANLVNRGYSNKIFEDTVDKLRKRNIKFVVHLIAGLPGEKKDDFIESVKYINSFKPWGIKFHNIYIQINSPLYEYSKKTGFNVLEMDEYIDWVTDAIMHLDKDIIIHRLTGDPDRKKLVQPQWIRNKLRVLSEIDRVLCKKGGEQGCLL